MVTADGPDRPATATSQRAALGALRARVLWGLALFFALVMAVVTAEVVVGSSGDMPLIVHLAALAVVLPVAMALLVRSILGPATQLETATAQLRSMYSQARIDALLDPITGLGNHRAFQEELHRQIESAARHEHPLALAIIDLDDLKRVNDEHGHAVGDQLLSSMGHLLAGASRSADRAFRIGGDEFALLLPHADADAAHASMRRMLASAVSAETTYGRAFSFSCGVSAYPAPSTEGSDLLANADAALYWAKRHGRTDVQLFDLERHGGAEDGRSRIELAEAIDTVVAQRLITPVYQPIFDLVSGEPVGFEGLVRPTAEAHFRDASALFSAAEQADRTVELDMLAIETISAGLGEPIEGYLSVNVSPRSFETEQFRVTDLVSALAASGFEPSRVVLELTEREAIEDMDRLRASLAACRSAGFRIAADDVGAGNAGLQLLSEVEFDIVKIDVSLVRGGVLRDSALAVLRAIQEIASRSDAAVVAEGIETVEQLDVLRGLGVSKGQGYLLAAPGNDPTADRLDIDALIASHQARRRALLDSWDVTPADAA